MPEAHDFVLVDAMERGDVTAAGLTANEASQLPGSVSCVASFDGRRTFLLRAFSTTPADAIRTVSLLDAMYGLDCVVVAAGSVNGCITAPQGLGPVAPAPSISACLTSPGGLLALAVRSVSARRRELYSSTSVAGEMEMDAAAAAMTAAIGEAQQRGLGIRWAETGQGPLAPFARTRALLSAADYCTLAARLVLAPAMSVIDPVLPRDALLPLVSHLAPPEVVSAVRQAFVVERAARLATLSSATFQKTADDCEPLAPRLVIVDDGVADTVAAMLASEAPPPKAPKTSPNAFDAPTLVTTALLGIVLLLGIRHR